MKPKSNFKLIRENMKFNINSNQFKLVLLLLICFNLYGTTYLSANLSYLDGLINIITNGYYNVALISIVLLNTINTFDKFEKNQFFIIRFENRKMYLKQLIINIFVSNSILLVMNLVLILIGLNMFASNRFIISNILDYSISNFLYVLFYLFRFFLIIQIISIINTCLLKLFNKKIVIFLNLIFCLIILFTPYDVKRVVSSISNMFLVISDYMRLHYYNSFILEVLCSSIYILILSMIGVVLFIFSEHKMKDIGD